MKYYHQPVLLKEVIEGLQPKQGKNYIDCTLGGGGHIIPLLYAIAPHGSVMGIDLDQNAHNAVQERIQDDRIVYVKDNFQNITKIVKENHFENIYGILMDLGYSSRHVDDNEAGFGFEAKTLDMRYGKEGITAGDIVNTWNEEDLEGIFAQYGEERLAREIAKKIVQKRQLSVFKKPIQLAELVEDVYARRYKSHSKKHPATKVFQALRIAVNDELNVLKEALNGAVNVLEKGGRIVVISYHSLEDRIVKDFLRTQSTKCVCPPNFPKCTCQQKATLKIITKKPIVPDKEETEKNPRSRSAKLRIAEKI